MISFYDFCMMFVFYFYAIYDENTTTAHGGHFPDPYKLSLSYQIHHFKIVSFSTLERIDELIIIVHYWYIYQSMTIKNK